MLRCAVPAEQGLDFDALESRLGDLERELTELNANSERLNRRCGAQWAEGGLG